MNVTKAKISFLLFVLFVVFYIASYSPKMYVISFLLTTFFILLEKTNLIKKNTLPFEIPYKPIILLCILTLGFFYLYNHFFKREGFEDGKENNKEVETTLKLKEIETRLGEKLTNNLNEHINDLLKKRDEVHALSMRDFKEDVKLQLNQDKQNLKFNERKYKIQQEIEELEDKNAKKQTPLDKKNLLLFKQNLAKHLPDIISELKENANTILYTKAKTETENLSFVDKVVELVRTSFTILNKEDRMVYVGTSSLIVSFALMLFDISL